MAWTDGPFVGFDTETTGVNPARDYIVSICLVIRQAGEADQVIEAIIDPGVEIPEGAARVHGMSTAYVREHGHEPREVLDAFAKQMVKAMAAGVPIVAYNGSYDFQILEANLARLGLPTLAERLGREPGPMLDPLVMDRALDRFRKGPRKLINACAAYGVPERDDYHSAAGDVLATLDVLAAMLERYPQLGEQTLDEVYAWERAAHAEWARDFNKWLASKGRTDLNPEWWPLPPAQ